MSARKVLQEVVSISLTLVMLYFVYQETGPATVMTLCFIWVALRMQSSLNRKQGEVNRKFLDILR